MEKELVLEVPCVLDLNTKELKEIDGGSILGMAAGFVGGAILAALTVEYITEGGQACVDAFMDGWNSVE